jgi:PAS domain-containing protein
LSPTSGNPEEAAELPDFQSSMNRVAPSPCQMIDIALGAAREGEARLHALLDDLPAPIYLTDADGWVTFFNRACVDFAGRTPIPGEDRWCVTWRLYTEGGTFLPHEQCPMAVAIRERTEVRGAIAVAERPDGTRVLFTPYPTPITDADGALVGAVNILIDITDLRQAEALRAQALRCRRLAATITDARTLTTLRLMAEDFEEKARCMSGDRLDS